MKIKIPEGASMDEIKSYIRWMDQCKELGWPEESMERLAELWWEYHPPKSNITEAE